MGIAENGEQILPWDLQQYLQNLRVENFQIDPAEIEIEPMGRLAIVGAFAGNESEQGLQLTRTTRELYVRGHIGAQALVGFQIIRPAKYKNTDLDETAGRLEASIADFRAPSGDFGHSRMLDGIVPGHLELSPGGSREYRSGRLGYLIQKAWMQFEIAAKHIDAGGNSKKSLIIVTDPETAALADPGLSPEFLSGGGIATYSTLGQTNRWDPSARTGSYQQEPKQSRSNRASARPDDTLQKQSDVILSHHSLGPEKSA